MVKRKKYNNLYWKYLMMNLKLVKLLILGVYGTKEELEDTEDFFPFIYVPINIHWKINYHLTWIYHNKYIIN